VDLNTRIAKFKKLGNENKYTTMLLVLVADPHAFYRAASMQGGLSHERNVCLSVRPSVRLSNV